MKTSNKTNSRFLVIAVALMVMSLVQLSAQKSYNNNSLAYFGKQIFESSKKDILHAFYATKESNSSWNEETLEDWMLHPAEWNVKSNESVVENIDVLLNEMILEDWMMTTSWSENSAMEEELQLENWMMDPNWITNTPMEEEMTIEAWMNNPFEWDSVN